MFATAKLFDLSTPLHSIMSKDVPVAGLYTRISEIKRKVVESKYRCVLLVDGNNRLIGIVTRTDLLQPIRKKVILVDHNEISQAVDGVQEAEILESHQIDIPSELPGLLLSGILSDTLILTLSTTTERDKEVAHKLADILDVEIEEYGKELRTSNREYRYKGKIRQRNPAITKKSYNRT